VTTTGNAVAIMQLMSDVTQLLDGIKRGDPQASAELLPLVYNELRRLAAEKMALERPGHTLQATALVHEAYLRLVDGCKGMQWDSRWHFFAAAAEAMRRIVINRARDKKRLKRGGNLRRVEFEDVEIALDSTDEDLLALDEALVELEAEDAVAAQVVKLRFFAGLKHREVAAALGISLRSAERQSAFAQAWLYDRLHRGDGPARG
jgi:RNA polymerase sigma factor (TIGR02999 family)